MRPRKLRIGVDQQGWRTHRRSFEEADAGEDKKGVEDPEEVVGVDIHKATRRRIRT